MRVLRVLAVVLAAAVLVAGAWLPGRVGKTVTAYFTSTVGVYPGSDVRALGVAIGSVESVEPEGTQVRVTMSVDADAPIPGTASALVVTPSVVGDRYVQLTPVRSDGDRITDGAVIPVDRTAVPIEVDQILRSLNDLTKALGPDGANSDGAVDEFLTSAAATLDGNGRTLNDALRELGKAARTLGGSAPDAFTTLDNLQKFTTMLAATDQGVRAFNDQLAQVLGLLAGQREQFGAALGELTGALGKVEAFIKDNRGRIKSNVDKLLGTTKVLADQKASLTEALDTAPGALTDLLGTYDPKTGTLDGRANLNEFSMIPGGAR